MKNIVICFPGGAGGHFIAAVVLALQGNTTPALETDGSMHGIENVQTKLSGITLDTSKFSARQEEQVIDSITNVPLTLGHFRNISKIVAKGCSAIYITFEQDDKDEINNRLYYKISNLKLDEKTYNILAGTDWPNYAAYLNGEPVAELIGNKFVIGAEKHLDDWYYILPEQTQCILEIKFKEILTGYDFIERLAQFMGVTDYDAGSIISIIDTYRQRNQLISR